MNTNAIKLEDRFSDFELACMFNVECNPDADQKETRVPFVEGVYEFNDCKVPLLKLKKRKLTKRTVHFEDHVKPGITREPAGKSRVADLARFYAENPGESAFDIPGIDE